MSDLKGQLKLLESNNVEYMQKNLDLEEVGNEQLFIIFLLLSFVLLSYRSSASC
jgi:hypothetical protein